MLLLDSKVQQSYYLSVLMVTNQDHKHNESHELYNIMGVHLELRLPLPRIGLPHHQTFPQACPFFSSNLKKSLNYIKTRIRLTK